MAVTYNTTNKTLSYIYRATGGGVNFSANLAGNAVLDYFDDAAVVNDAIYFAPNSNYAWSDILVNVGTFLVADDITIVWEYYSYSTGWTAIENFQDDTNGFQNAGANVVRFPAQWKWRYNAVNGVTKSWIRARITAVTNITEGGANQTTTPYAKNGMVNINGYTDGSPCSFTIVSDYLYSNYAYLGQLKKGNHFDFRSVGLMINSRLKTIEESIEMGNTPSGNTLLRTQNLNYLESGQKVGTESGRKGSQFFAHFAGNTYLLSFGSSTKLYGTSFLSPNAGGGYPSLNGEVIDSHIDMIPQVYGTIINTRFRIGSVGFISFSPTVFSKNKVIIGNKMAYCYQGSLTFNELDYEFDGGSAMLYLYQTYANPIFTFNDPVTPLPSQASSPRTVARELRGQGNITTLLNYDNTGGYTDQTAEARDATVDDVDLTGATGVPEVGDCIYFDRGGANIYSAYKSFEVTMGSVVNSDNTYIWEIYTASGWKEAKVWDCTEQFTKSGMVYASMRSIDNTPQAKTTINAVYSYWFRARITSAGNSKPVATKITGAREHGVSDWKAYEKYSLNLKVTDKHGTGIGTATATVKDSNGVEKFSVTTDGNGDIVPQYLIAKSWYFDPINYPGNYQGIAEVVEGAFTIEIKKAGYQTYSKKFTLDSKIDWIIRLKRSVVNIDQEVIL